MPAISADQPNSAGFSVARPAGAMHADTPGNATKQPVGAELQLLLLNSRVAGPLGADVRTAFRRQAMLALPAFESPAMVRPFAALVLFALLGLGGSLGFTAAFADGLSRDLTNSTA